MHLGWLVAVASIVIARANDEVEAGSDAGLEDPWEERYLHLSDAFPWYKV
eukprot:SAG11_NODE_36349_length_262_cov_0.625767_1_plen_49_part_01